MCVDKKSDLKTLTKIIFYFIFFFWLAKEERCLTDKQKKA